ncbi:flagellar assembly lytic transglycosylase [Treponema sp.]|uniref:flagellar assembly lytic transglycosylase n=1 Tax=Treponema sp. TaxID=166 RepID=UPI00389009E9
MKLSRITVTTLCFLLAFSGFGCAQNDTLQKKYGADASYFIALNALRENNTSQAIRCLKDAAKKGSPLISRKAMEKLTEVGSIQERTASCRQLYKTFSDESSLLRYAKELYNQKEYYSVISKTDSINCRNSENELVYYRFLSMLKKNDSRLKKELRTWISDRPYTSWHSKFYVEFKKIEGSYSDSLAEFRWLVYNKDFAAATEKINSVLELKANRKPIVFSDTGKALLYGTKDFQSAATFMDSLCKTSPENCRFYCNFYAGRFYEKNGDTAKSLERFTAAMEQAESDALRDNALWYILNTSLKDSAQDAYDSLSLHLDNLKDKEYYNDFFDTLSVRLISTQKWDLYKKTTDLIWNKASPEVCSKFSYITARLIQTGFIKNAAAGEASEYLRKALNSGSDLYYKILAIEKLGLTDKDIEKEFCSIGNRIEITADTEKENLLYGYADFGLAEYINDDYQEYRENISTECAKKIAQFLSKCGTEDEKFLTQSIRIASRRVFNSEKNPDKELLSLAFPQNYRETVHKTCDFFEQPEYILYALIRSESFFDSKVISHAGAVGLTQLMESTAGDIAKKLKLTEYDLTDTDTNIMFGSFYLEELTRRLDGSIILAVFSYNGGISRVRSWVKSAAMEFGMKKVPHDLFLEALPYTETREYGRKVLSASGMYGWLYYDLSPSDIAKEILK